MPQRIRNIVTNACLVILTIHVSAQNIDLQQTTFNNITIMHTVPVFKPEYPVESSAVSGVYDLSSSIWTSQDVCLTFGIPLSAYAKSNSWISDLGNLRFGLGFLLDYESHSLFSFLTYINAFSRNDSMYSAQIQSAVIDYPNFPRYANSFWGIQLKFNSSELLNGDVSINYQFGLDVGAAKEDGGLTTIYTMVPYAVGLMFVGKSFVSGAELSGVLRPLLPLALIFDPALTRWENTNYIGLNTQFTELGNWRPSAGVQIPLNDRLSHVYHFSLYVKVEILFQ